MALGFGHFRAVDKVLPGVYVNLLGGAAGLRPPLVDPDDPGTGPEGVDGTAIATERDYWITTENLVFLIMEIAH